MGSFCGEVKIVRANVNEEETRRVGGQSASSHRLHWTGQPELKSSLRTAIAKPRIERSNRRNPESQLTQVTDRRLRGRDGAPPSLRERRPSLTFQVPPQIRQVRSVSRGQDRRRLALGVLFLIFLTAIVTIMIAAPQGAFGTSRSRASSSPVLGNDGWA